MTTLRKLLAAAALFAFATPALADYPIKDGDNIRQVIRAGTVAGKILPYMAMVDTSGNAFGTSSNPFSIGFGTGVTLPSFATPQHFICDSGCSGGGGGGVSATFGAAIGTLGTPVGFKDASGNFQPLLGDVTNGQWVSIKASTTIGVSGTFWPYTLGQQVNGSSVPVVLTAAQLTTLTPLSSVGISGTLPAFAATPTFNLGTLNGAATAANQASVIGTVAAGTAAANSTLVGGVYNSSPITLSTGQQAAIQFDVNGYLKVNLAAGSSGGGTSSSFAATFPATGTAVGMSQGGNMVALTGTSGNLNVQCANCSGSGVSTADGASFTAGSSLFAGAGGFFQTTATSNPVTTGNQGLFQMTAQRALFTNLRNASGAEIGIAAAPLQVSIANTGLNGTAIAVTGPLTDAQLRATAVPVSLSSTTITGSVTVTGTVTANAGTNLNTSLLALEGGGNLATIVTNTGRIPAQGQALAAASLPVVLTAAQISTLTPLATVAVTQSTSPWVVSLTSTTITGTVAVTQSGAWTMSGTGTAGSAASGVLTVQGIASMTPLLGNPGTASLWGINTIGSTTSGQSGQLAFGAVTTAAPTYTTAQSNPLSLTTAGALRVDGSGVTQPVSLTSTTITGTVAVTQSGSWTLAANQSVNVAQINGVTPLMGNGGTGTGSQRVTIASDNTAFSVNAAATLTAETTKNIGTIRMTGNVGGVLDAIGQNVAAPANWLQAGCQFQTSPTTITAGNGSPLQCNNGGKMLVSDTVAQGYLATIATAAVGANPVVVNGVVTAQTGVTGGASSSPQTGTIVSANTDLSSVAGVAVGVPANYGTSPGAVKVQGVNAAVTQINAGETHVGEIGSNQIKVQVASTVTASAYSAGNALGGLQTIAGAARVSGSLGAAGTGGIITGAQLNSKAAQSGVQVDIFIFDANPTASTCTDKTAFVLATADFDKVVGMLTVPSAQANGAGWFSGGTGSLGVPTYFPVTYDLASSTSIYACAVVRAALTPASTSDISWKYNILRN